MLVQDEPGSMYLPSAGRFVAISSKGAFYYYSPSRTAVFLALHGCAALAGKHAELVFDDTRLGKRGVAFLWS